MKRNRFEEEVYLTGTVGKHKLLTTAEAFRNLADSFAHLPKRKENLSEPDLNQIFEELGEKFCKSCSNCNKCWGKNYYQTYKEAYELLEEIDRKGEQLEEITMPSFLLRCQDAKAYLEEAVKLYRQERLNLIWNNRLLEARETIGQQFLGMSEIILHMKDSLCVYPSTDPVLRQKIKLALQAKRLVVQSVVIKNRLDQKWELWVTAKTKNDRCIPVKEIAAVISGVLNKDIVPDKQSKTILNGESATIVFLEDTNFNVLYGVSRRIKEQECISGDHFSYMERGGTEAILCLSDGMGSGMLASKESELVIELLEQLIEAGFTKEIAIRMLNSMLVIKSDEPLFTTIDLCSIDLYTGLSMFLKCGAASTFIKHSNGVEVIPSTTLPIGLVNQMETEPTTRKLYNGDMVIMVTDGVLDTFPVQESEQYLINVIQNIDCDNPREMAVEILDYIEAYTNYVIKDDMTVLAAGIWEK